MWTYRVVTDKEWEDLMAEDITKHEGKKYLRKITSVMPDKEGSISVDVYCVIEAFNITCPARQHAVKKLLCAGQRSKGDTLADLKGVLAAVNRAIELETSRMSCQDD